MRKATLVLATSVAFLLFVVPNSYAGIKKKVQLPTPQSVANGSGIPVKSGSSLSIPGVLQGEFIPGDNPSRATPIKVLPTIDFSIPRTINQAKGILKANAGSLVVGGVISGMVAGLDWLIDENGKVNKKLETYDGFLVSKPPTFHPISLCNTYPSSQTLNKVNITNHGGATYAVVVFQSAQEVLDAGYNSYNTSCTSSSLGYYPVNGSFPFSGAKIISEGEIVSDPTPVTDSDLNLVDAYVNSQSSDWLRDLLRESCLGSISPDRCFEDLKDNVSLSGPSSVNGPSSLTTSTGPNGTTSKETKTTFAITYGSDYFIYAPTTTTTTVNPDGTTEVETEEPPAEEEPAEEEIDATIGDPYAPVVDKYNDIAGGLGDLEGNMSFINYGPWYSFGGACSPITLNLPVMGVYTIDHCPYVIDWIRPTLGFLFAVWTWLHCFALWRETLQNARPI